MSHTDIFSDAFYPGRARVEIRLDPSPSGGWLPISNVVVMFESPEIERMSAETYALGAADIAIVTVGKRKPIEITIRAIFDDDINATASRIWSTFTNAAQPSAALRWKPRGTGVSMAYVTANEIINYVNATPPAYLFVPVTKYTLPELDPSKADPAMFSMTLLAPAIVQYATANDTGLDPVT